MLKYKFDVISYQNGDSDLIIKMEDESKRLVATFLMSDIQGGDISYAIHAIDKVLTGKSDYEELNGNICGVEIHQDKTEIYDNLAEDGIGDWCTVNTSELKELIYIWHQNHSNFIAKKD